jgi:hypothetical protein
VCLLFIFLCSLSFIADGGGGGGGYQTISQVTKVSSLEFLYAYSKKLFDICVLGLWSVEKPPVCTAVQNGQSYKFVPLLSLHGAKRKNFTSTFNMCHVV